MKKNNNIESITDKIILEQIISEIKNEKQKNTFDLYNFILRNLDINYNFQFLKEESIILTSFLKAFSFIKPQNKLYLFNINKVKNSILTKQYIKNEKIFKLFFIYVFLIWENIKSKNDEKIYISSLKIIKFLIQIFNKLYHKSIFKLQELEIFSKLFLFFSIFEIDKYNNNKNLYENNSIKSFFFFDLSIQIYKTIFLKRINKEISEDEENMIINFLELIFEKIIKTRKSTQLILLDYDINTTRFYEFLKINNSQKIKEIILKIYLCIYQNRINDNFIHFFIKQIKNGLVNLQEKEISEIIKNINLINLPLNILLKENEKDYIKLLPKKCFYLEDEKAGFYVPNINLSTPFSIIFSFNFNPIFNSENKYTLFTIKIEEKKEEKNFEIFIIKRDNIYYLNSLFKNQKSEEYNIEPEKLYILCIIFNDNEITLSIKSNLKIQELKTITIKKLSKNIKGSFLLGCKKEIINEQNNNININLVNCYQGFLGSFLLINKELNENEKKKILNYDFSVNRFFFDNEFLNSLNYQLKIIPNLFSFYDKIEKIDFVELKEESFEKEKEFKYYYYNNEIIKSINKKYSVLYYSDDLNNKEIRMKEYFSSFFTIVESNNSIFSFVKLNGLSIISLLFEYFYQVLIYLNSKNERNEIINLM